MFQAVFAHHQEHLTVLTVSGSVHPSCCRLVSRMMIQSSAPDDGRKLCPKHVELTWNNKLIYIVHLVGYFHSCITTLFTSTLDLQLRKKLVKCYVWSIALYGAETWTLRAMDQKHLETFEMWCWRRMEKISWTDHVRNEDVLLRVKEQRTILHEIRKRKANWIGHILRRNCLLQRVTEGKIQGGIEVTGRQGRRRRNLLDDLKEKRGYSHLKEEALDRTMWRARFGRGFGPVVRQTAK